MERTERITKKFVNWLQYQTIGATIEVHRHLGPGLLESVYEKALLHELELRGFHTEAQKTIPVYYKSFLLDVEFRYDMLVENVLLVENKSVIELHPIFEAVLLTYMKHLQKPKGILLNFNVRNLVQDGQRIFVNEYYAALPDE